MMVGTMAEGATSACVRVTPRFPMAACRRGPPDPHPMARTEQPGLIGTSQPSLTLPALPGTSRRSFLFRIRRLAGDAACDGWRWPKGGIYQGSSNAHHGDFIE
jgi:hypothetical protein